MTTIQASPESYRVSPPPFSIGNPAELNSADLPTNQDHINSESVKSQISDLPSAEAAPRFPASAYHVPPEPFTPSPNPYHPGEPAHRPRPKVRDPLPHRRPSMFSADRTTTLAH